MHLTLLPQISGGAGPGLIPPFIDDPRAKTFVLCPITCQHMSAGIESELSNSSVAEIARGVIPKWGPVPMITVGPSQRYR